MKTVECSAKGTKLQSVKMEKRCKQTQKLVMKTNEDKKLEEMKMCEEPYIEEVTLSQHYKLEKVKANQNDRFEKNKASQEYNSNYQMKITL